jgi:hypothetical protein
VSLVTIHLWFGRILKRVSLLSLIPGDTTSKNNAIFIVANPFKTYNDLFKVPKPGINPDIIKWHELSVHEPGAIVRGSI